MVNIECNEVYEVTRMIYKWAIELSVHCLLNAVNGVVGETNDILLLIQ